MKRRRLVTDGDFNAGVKFRSEGRPGFTIVELLIVVVVIGILAAISIIAYNGVQVRATDSTTKSDASGAGKQLELAKAEAGAYPNSVDSLTKSPGTTFAYTKTEDGFELTASADRKGTKTYCVTSSSLTPKEGKCAIHEDTAASCFTFTTYITDYSGDSSCPRNVVIPSEIDGRIVTNIGASTFSNSQLTSVTIPDSVRYIGNRAFEKNQLTSVAIPNGVGNIPYRAFYGNQLIKVNIPDSVTIIGIGAFLSNQLTDVTIPDSVTIIENQAFQGNRLTSVTIPNSVTSIGDQVFYGNQLTSVTIPDSVTNIGRYVFYGNPGINCRIPSSATYSTSSLNCATIERY